MSDSLGPGTVPQNSAADARFDWSERADSLTERLDGPLTYADWLAASQDIARINRWTRAYTPTLAFLERILSRRGVGYEPLRVVDVGCGHGDVLRRVARWAAQRSIAVRLTGVDLHPYAARAARQWQLRRPSPAGAIEWVTADVFEWQQEQAPDVILSSLFTHHLVDRDVARFLSWSERHARWGWMVNDLRRSERAYRLFGWASRLAGLHPLVLEDGLTSIRRAFSQEDWMRLCEEARIADAHVVVRGTRLCVERVRDRAQEFA